LPLPTHHEGTLASAFAVRQTEGQSKIIGAHRTWLRSWNDTFMGTWIDIESAIDAQLSRVFDGTAVGLSIPPRIDLHASTERSSRGGSGKTVGRAMNGSEIDDFARELERSARRGSNACAPAVTKVPAIGSSSTARMLRKIRSFYILLSPLGHLRCRRHRCLSRLLELTGVVSTRTADSQKLPILESIDQER
jgi:hypothetical protein